jgi:pSer/pThr/pTyr-binding forkhead associated (FHA) protein
MTSYTLVDSQRQIPLVAGENVVGRDPEARVCLDSPSVSRRHARITIAGDRVTLEDLQSKNGTEAHGAVVSEPVSLTDGDAIRFGSVVLTLRVWRPDASTKSGIDL